MIIGPAAALRRACGLGARPSLVGSLLGGSGVTSPTSVTGPHGTAVASVLDGGGLVASHRATSSASASAAARPTSIGAVALRVALVAKRTGLVEVEVPVVGAVVGRGQAGASLVVGAGGGRLRKRLLGRWGILGTSSQDILELLGAEMVGVHVGFFFGFFFGSWLLLKKKSGNLKNKEGRKVRKKVAMKGRRMRLCRKRAELTF